MFASTEAAPVVSSNISPNKWIINGFMVPVLPASNKFVTDNNFSTAFENHDQQTTAIQDLAGSIPNPFMANFSTLPSQTGTTANSDLFNLHNITENSATENNHSSVIGSTMLDDASKRKQTSEINFSNVSATPPPRPPLPSASTNIIPSSELPTVTGGSTNQINSTNNVTKSAYDDLNDQIRIALGGSSSRQASTELQSYVQPTQSQDQYHQSNIITNAGTTRIVGQQIIDTTSISSNISIQSSAFIGSKSLLKHPNAEIFLIGKLFCSCWKYSQLSLDATSYDINKKK
ncbi:Protein of unknown function [Cotesia congregata]|uniref:Uncharacterized protein n=1 Tax=Cotesia congregata TaxID=51543 RepID=A0A8J2HGI4_COTCN|nr:Protein of unknown function [Cotesia congregata]